MGKFREMPMPCRIRHNTLAAGVCLLVAAACGGRAGRTAASARERPAASALTFTMRIAGTSFGGKALPGQSIPTQFRDGVLRLDFAGERDAGVSHRSSYAHYLLVNVRAKTTTVIMPERRLYWETKFDTAVGRRAESRSTVAGVDVSGRLVSGHESVNGYAAKRYRITTRYTETPLDDGQGYRRKNVSIDEDIWVADAFTDVVDPMLAYLRLVRASSTRDDPGGTLDEVAEKQADARRRLFEGLPIKTAWAYAHTFDGRWTASRTLIIELLDVKHANLDPAAFRPPDGYRPFDVAAFMSAARRLWKGALDSAKGPTKAPRE